MTGRRIAGLGLLSAGDAAQFTGVLLFPLWLVPAAPHAGYGSGLAVGAAIVLLGVALCQHPVRALAMLTGLAVALTVCALAWPLPGWVSLVLLCVGSVLHAGSRELTPVRTLGFGDMALAIGIVGLLLASRVLTLDHPGALSVQLALGVLVAWLTLRLMWQMLCWMDRPTRAEGFDERVGHRQAAKREPRHWSRP